MKEVSSCVLHDVLVAFPWSAVNLLLIYAAFRIRDAAFPRAGGAARILDISVIYCAAVVFALTLLGTVGLFSGPAMLAGIALAALTGIVIARGLSSGDSGVSDEAATEETGAPGGAISAGWLIAFGVFCGHVIVDGFLQFPSDFDSLMYHMPLVDHWLQAGSLYAPHSASWWSPGNSELLAAWASGPFSGDFLVPLNNIPVVIVWTAATLDLARRLGMQGAWPHVAAVATLGVYPLLQQTDNASNDLMVVAFCIASAAYTLRFLSSQRRADLLLCGAAVGLLAGVKYFAIGYAAVLFATLGLGQVLVSGWKTAFRSLAVASTVAVLFGGYWYVRNFVGTSLPLYPVGTTGETTDLGYPDIWSTSFWGNGDPRLLELGMEAVWRMCGLVHCTAVAATPAIALLLFGAAVRLSLANKRKPLAAVTPLLCAVWLLGSGAVLIVTPFSVEDQPGTLNQLRWAYAPVRYGLSYLSFSVLAAVLLIEWASNAGGRWLKKLSLKAVTALSVLQIAQRIWTSLAEFDFAAAAMTGVGLSVLTYAIVTAVSGRMLLRRPLSIVLAASLLAAVSAGVGFLSLRWHQGLAAHFNRFFDTTQFSQIDEIFPEGARIMVFDTQPYAFFGAARQHRVINPRLLRSSDRLDSVVVRHKPDVIAVARGEHSGFDRYRGSWERIAEAPCVAEARGTGYFRIFFVSLD